MTIGPAKSLNFPQEYSDSQKILYVVIGVKCYACPFVYLAVQEVPLCPS